MDRQRVCGFSLLEILLSLSIFLLLSGAVIFNFSTLDSNSKILESVYQVEGLIKYVKAISANTGRNFRLDLSGVATNRIFWEADPLGNPNQYVCFSGGLPGFNFLDFVDVSSETANVVQIFPNGEMNDKIFVISSKENKNIKYKIIIVGVLGLIRHERLEIIE